MAEPVAKRDEAGRWVAAVEAVNTRLAWTRLLQFILVVTAFMIPLTWQMICSGYGWWWGVSATLLVVLGWIVIDRLTAGDTRVLSRRRDRLDRTTELAKRIVMGEIDGNELHEETPWPFSALVRPIRNPSPEQTVTRVAGALDWYLDPDRRFIPGEWIYAIAAMVGLFLLIRWETPDGLENISSLSPFLWFMIARGITDSFVIGAESLDLLSEGFRRCAESVDGA